MQGKRTERYAELIKQSLSQNILTKIRDPRMGFVTLTHVEIAPDLKYAKIYYTVMGDEKVQKSTAAALEHSRGFLQRELASEIKMRITPILQFHFDNSVGENMKIEAILKKIHEERSE
ncbi:MAG: 30S ribosome-binding factor RbfA [Candidatus Omnitrophica bacterium]|nr:30S ribosome-binding factor RbfA [Candidatus Omnitrophota bacterium]